MKTISMSISVFNFRYFLFLLLFLGFVVPANGSSNAFIADELAAVQEFAREQNRPVFIDFTASWCAPCRNLDEYTFSDRKVKKMLSDRFVSVQIDIDDTAGALIAAQYNVKSLPTMLVLDSKGKLLKRIKTAFGPTDLIKVLQPYVPALDRDIAVVAYPYPPASSIVYPDGFFDDFAPEPSYAATTGYEAPNVGSVVTTPVSYYPNPLATTTTTQPATTVVSTPTTAPTNSTFVSDAPSVPAVTAAAPEPESSILPNLSGTGLYRLHVSEKEMSGYSVQIGVYADYQNVLRETANAKTVYGETVLVHIAEMNGRTVYKLFLGEFQVAEDAQQLSQRLKMDGNVGTFVKDLSEFAVGDLVVN